MDDVVKLLLALMFIAIVLGSAAIAFKQVVSNNDSEINDPNRNHYITRSDDTLIHGEVYEREFIPAHTETRRRTEMQAGMGFGVNPANGNLEHHYGFFPVTVNYMPVNTAKSSCTKRARGSMMNVQQRLTKRFTRFSVKSECRGHTPMIWIPR